MSKNRNLKIKKPLSIKVYAELARERYRDMSKKEKSSYLATLAADCQCTRQHARRVMSKMQRSSPLGPRIVTKNKAGRKSRFVDDDQVIWWLQTFWVGMNFPNTKLMPSMLKEWLSYFQADGFDDVIRGKILQVSASTIERILKSYKKEQGKKHFAATRGRGRLKTMLVRIPQRDLDFKVKTSGFTEGDTVAHCGDRLMGQHGWTLNTVCIHSAWTESEAFLGKEAQSIVTALVQMRTRFPFPMRGYHSDCGSEFLNDTVATYLEDPKNFVTQTHGRAYKKNDQARVEQRNWTHVRQSFGYDRVEEQKVVDCMNDIYRNELRILRNFFTATMKQKTKVKIASKYKRTFEVPKTPFERVMEDTGVGQSIKDRLQEEKKTYNPFEIKKSLDQKLKVFEKLLQNQNKISETKTDSSKHETKEAA